MNEVGVKKKSVSNIDTLEGNRSGQSIRTFVFLLSTGGFAFIDIYF